MWKILVVDDEEDVHLVTSLALKHRTWARRAFHITGARSALEARRLIEPENAPEFDVALVDVVMETRTAGLQLCELLRERYPPSLRIILRTGQAGSAPEEEILNRYEIDFYLAKPEVTAEKLFAVVRACLRSSHAIAKQIAFSRQLQNRIRLLETGGTVTRQMLSFTRAMHGVASVEDLLVFMDQGLELVELKHTSRTHFVHDVTQPPPAGARVRVSLSPGRITDAIATANRENRSASDLRAGERYGLPAGSFLLPFVQVLDTTGTETTQVSGGLYVEMSPPVSDQAAARLRTDVLLYVDNWKATFARLWLEQRVARERMLRDRMYFERMEGIANMVTGVAHEINTPLGVASTANSMISSLVSRLVEAEPGSEDQQEHSRDLDDACALMGRNIARAHRLIESFKMLSVGQLSDQRMLVDLEALMKDCVDSMRPLTRKHEITINIHTPVGGLSMKWDGFPGHLSQVIVNLIQNVARYAYPDSTGGTVDIRLTADEAAGMCRIEFEDYGAGLAAEVRDRLFQPFVTTGRSQGGTGLGLAISFNIVTNLLRGRIACDSKPGRGTRFTIEVPAFVPDPPTDHGGMSPSS